MRSDAYEITGCPICYAAQTTEVADHEAIKDEVARVWEFHSRRLRQPVPTEYLMDRVFFSQAPPLRLVECERCGHVYRNPRERSEALRRTYAEHGADGALYSSLFYNQREFFRVRARRIRELAGTIDSGLEVGCYAGAFLAEAGAAGLPFTGLDINEHACAFARAHGLTAVQGAIEDLEGAGLHDAIVIWNTFEQLPDVRAAALAARRLLRKGGLFALRVPVGSFYSTWRRRLGGPFRAVAERVLIQNNLLGFPYRQGFSRRSMSALLASTGFRPRLVHGDTLVSVADRWTRVSGAVEERITKGVERLFHHGWSAPWIEIYASVS